MTETIAHCSQKRHYHARNYLEGQLQIGVYSLLTTGGLGSRCLNHVSLYKPSNKLEEQWKVTCVHVSLLSRRTRIAIVWLICAAFSLGESGFTIS